MLAAAQIRNAVAARISGLPLTLDRVFTSRTWPLADDDLPAWKVVTGNEDIETLTIHRPPLQAHALDIELRGIAKAVANLDDVLDGLAEAALGALFAAPPPDDTLAAITSLAPLTLLRIQREPHEEGEAAIGVVTLTLRATFRTASNAPGIIV